jgi:hypothetical protein
MKFEKEHQGEERQHQLKRPRGQEASSRSNQ